MGAQAGVRYSLENPSAYVQSNLVGHCNMLELARHRQVRHMVYASSSSVYGGNKSLPFRVEDRVDHPLSLYAATKKADELLSESYASLYRLPLTGLRFFTVHEEADQQHGSLAEDIAEAYLHSPRLQEQTREVGLTRLGLLYDIWTIPDFVV